MNMLSSKITLNATKVGTLFGVGVGPGDPELMTVKAARLISEAEVIAYFCKQGEQGHARRIVDHLVTPEMKELRLEYPFTTEISVRDPAYKTGMAAFYTECGQRLEEVLATGQNVVTVSEGDPFFYGSFMHLFDRIDGHYPVQIVPGVTAMSACWSHSKAPITRGPDSLAVLSGTMSQKELEAKIKGSDACVIMKVGRNLPKIRRALEHCGAIERAIFVERGSMVEEKILPLAEKDTDDAPYFSLVLVPTKREPTW